MKSGRVFEYLSHVNERMGGQCCSDEDTDVKALVSSWIKRQEGRDIQMLTGWIEDYFYRALEWVLKQVHTY